MSADELEELKEHAEKAREDRSLAAVSLTMAVLAVCVAVVSLLGHRAHTEEVVLQAKASDQWAYYQAKSIREHEDVLFTELAGVVTSNDATAAAKVCQKFEQEAERYKHDKDEIKGEADKLEGEVILEQRLSGNWVGGYLNYSPFRTANLLALGDCAGRRRSRGGGYGGNRALSFSAVFPKLLGQKGFHAE
jgi:hypothetical protein